MKLLNIICLLCGVLFSSSVEGQMFFTKSGRISFFSKTPMENIDAYNKSANCVLDTQTGVIELSALLRGFQFEKALMQEHFNENYVESDKYPKAIFKGKIINIQNVNLQKDGKHTVTLEGQLTMHGKTKSMSTPATLTIKEGNIIGNSQFSVKPEDFDIKIPSLVKDNIAKNIDINVEVTLTPLKR